MLPSADGAAARGEWDAIHRAGVRHPESRRVGQFFYRLPEVLTEYHTKNIPVSVDIATGHSRRLQQMLDKVRAWFVRCCGASTLGRYSVPPLAEDICLIYARV